jgi:hypothetical protein
MLKRLSKTRKKKKKLFSVKMDLDAYDVIL